MYEFEYKTSKYIETHPYVHLIECLIEFTKESVMINSTFAHVT
jgi:hypothetical protein